MKPHKVNCTVCVVYGLNIISYNIRNNKQRNAK